MHRTLCSILRSQRNKSYTDPVLEDPIGQRWRLIDLATDNYSESSIKIKAIATYRASPNNSFLAGSLKCICYG